MTIFITVYLIRNHPSMRYSSKPLPMLAFNLVGTLDKEALGVLCFHGHVSGRFHRTVYFQNNFGVN